MPSKSQSYDYDSFEDDDDIDDFKGLKVTSNVAQHTFKVGNDSCAQLVSCPTSRHRALTD